MRLLGVLGLVPLLTCSCNPPARVGDAAFAGIYEIAFEDCTYRLEIGAGGNYRLLITANSENGFELCKTGHWVLGDRGGEAVLWLHQLEVDGQPLRSRPWPEVDPEGPTVISSGGPPYHKWVEVLGDSAVLVGRFELPRVR